MRQLFCSLFLALVISLMTGPVVWSYPIQYTIEGTVQGHGLNDTAGFLSQMGIAVGSTVSYTLLIDLNAAGTIQYADGTIAQYVDPNRPTFFAQYIAGSTITAENHLSTYNGITSNNLGGASMIINGQLHEYWLGISNGNNFLTINDMLQNPDSSGAWSVGSPYAFGSTALHNSIYDEFGNCSSFFFEAQITSAEPAPVPEPSTLAFLGMGLACLLLRRKINF